MMVSFPKQHFLCSLALSMAVMMIASASYAKEPNAHGAPKNDKHAVAKTSTPTSTTGNEELSLGTYGVWHAYRMTKNNQPVCYMATSQSFPSTKNFKRGAAHLMITHRPVEGSTDVVSYTSGYMYKPVVDVTAHIGAKTFSLFTQADTAWARDTHTDHEMASAIRAGTLMTISGTPSAKGAHALTDKISLKGAPDAYQAISKSCGVPYTAPKPKATPAKKASPPAGHHTKAKAAPVKSPPHSHPKATAHSGNAG